MKDKILNNVIKILIMALIIIVALLLINISATKGVGKEETEIMLSTTIWSIIIGILKIVYGIFKEVVTVTFLTLCSVFFYKKVKH